MSNTNTHHKKAPAGDGWSAGSRDLSGAGTSTAADYHLCPGRTIPVAVENGRVFGFYAQLEA
jgi:hypothetical protein